MAKDDEKSLRQLSLLSFLLGAGRPVTAPEVQESVEGYGAMTDEAFRKRFHDDRHDLNGLGFQITKLPHPLHEDSEAYFMPKEEYRLPDLGLTPRELRALAAALFLLQGGFPYENPLRLAVSNICLAGGERQDAEGSAGPIGIRVDGRVSTETRRKLSKLDDAVARRKSIEFEYRTAADSRPARRRLDPYGLSLISGRWYVVGRDQDRDSERMFRVDRITSRIGFTTKKPADFDVPPGYDPALHAARPPWLLGPAEGEAIIRVDQRFAWWVDRAYGQSAIRLSEEDGGLIYSFAYSDPGPLLAWVVRHRSVVLLKAPEELRAEVRRGMMSVIARHEALCNE